MDTAEKDGLASIAGDLRRIFATLFQGRQTMAETPDLSTLSQRDRADIGLAPRAPLPLLRDDHGLS